MRNKTVLVTGANGYIGNAVAKAFVKAGWKTYGLIRKISYSTALAQHEIYPVIGTPENLEFLNSIDDVAFDVIVSNTEDWNNPDNHLDRVEEMIFTIAKKSSNRGIRPLVMFTSGCKDYGQVSGNHKDKNIYKQDEESPINPPVSLIRRAKLGVKLLEQKEQAFDSVVLRPTIVYGNSSSHYGELFELAASSNTTLTLIANPEAIMHSLHVDDCAEAYVALAEHPDREQISNQAFNISNTNYETVEEIGTALASIYGLEFQLDIPEREIQLDLSVHSLANYQQWIDATKIRMITGWKEERLPFVEGIEQYRMAYEASKR